MAKMVTAIGALLLLVVVGYMVKSLLNTIDRNSTKGEVVMTPTPSVSATAPAPATAPTAPAAAVQVAAASGDAAAGKAKFATCAACHGANGEGAGAFPKLAGLSAADVEAKLKKYRAGEQVGPQTALMAPNAAALSDADIANLAAHIASLGAAAPVASSAAPAPAVAAAPAAAPAPAPVAAAGDAAAGKAKFATCAACHGANGEGAGAFPKLAGLSAADVEAKLKKYRAGEQVGPQTALMAPNAAALSDADIANLAAHIASLGAAAPAAPSAAPAPDASAAPAPVVDKVVLDRGKAIYTTCALCHGNEEAKVSRLLNAPLLPGHPASAVVALMKMYRDGKPVGPNSSFMFPIAQGLDEEDTLAVAAYIGTLKP